MTMSRRDARRLAMNAVDKGARILQGTLSMGPDGAKVDGIDIVSWLAEHADTELMVIVGGVEASDQIIHTCLTCGEDYTDAYCPRCAEARARLRGWSPNKSR